MVNKFLLLEGSVIYDSYRIYLN